MSTYTDIRYDYNLPSGSGGSLVLLSTQTASASASISFTSGIDSTYRTYMFKFIGIHPGTDNVNLTFQGSTDGGSNYNTTITSSFFQAYQNEGGTDTSLVYAGGFDLAQSTSFQILTNYLGADNDQTTSGTLHLFAPSSTTYVKQFISTSNCSFEGDYSVNCYVGGYFNTTSAINAIQFKMSSGNIDAGVIKMYGIA